jgi:transcriptional regulator with XRE-family HTH domain
MEHDSRSSSLGVGVDLDALLGDESGLDSASVAAIMHATGTLMRQVRLARGLILAEAAGECGVSSSVLCRTELARREPRLPLLLTLCGVLGVRLSAVLRMAEEAALPLGTQPWTEDPADLLGHTSTGRSAVLTGDRPATSGGVGHG